MFRKGKNVQQETTTEAIVPKKKSRDKKILFGILGGLLLMLVAVGLYLFIPRQEEQVATEEYVDCPLYWNVDREKYQPKLGGLSTRQPEADGYYTMRFLKRGEIVEYRVKDKELMLTIDSEDAMGLLVDEDGFVTEYVDLIDMGVREVASWYYVLRPKEDGATINTSTVGKGVNIEIKWQDDTGFWDVTNKEDYGCATKLELLDAVRVFNNADGKITDVFVVEREPSLAGLSPDQYCPHCDKVVTWTMWAFLDSIPSGEGHYWVVHDINTKKQYSMAKDVKQCINLNGKTITAAHQKRLISLHNEGAALAIMDLSEEQTGTLKGLGDGGMGSIVWVRYGQFDLYGGTLDASEVVTSSTGVAVNVFNKDCVFNMHGGTIIGGTVKSAITEKKISDAVGGALAVRGTVNMHGGTIRDGKCVTIKDKEGNQGVSAGGNVFVYKGGTFNMYDGLISGGTIVDNQIAYGGNVRVVPGAVWNMKGGVIEKGVSFNKAGNFSLFGTLNMSGGIIRDGKVMIDGESLKDAKVDKDSSSKNFYMNAGELNMTGGTIEGYAEIANKSCKLNISGSAKITGGKSNLTMPVNGVIDMGQLKKGAKIGISGGGFVTNETKESNRQYVFSDHDIDVLYIENKLLIGKHTCICGEQDGKHFGNCDGTKLAWAPWFQNNAAPTISGNWYLFTDVNLTKSHTLGKNAEMNLDLNGHSIKGEAGENGARVYSLRNNKVKMQLTDHSADKSGCIVAQGTGSKVGYGNCIWVAMDSELHMYGGCLDASKVSVKQDGTAVQIQKGCKFYMYGGSIKGGTSGTGGGAVSVGGEFEMHGGLVCDGKSEVSGGNIYVNKNGVFKLYGGEVRNGEAVKYGGNIGSDKQAYILGGVVNGGYAYAGGNLWAKQSLVIEGGIVKKGTADYGGNIFAQQATELTITDATISKGVAKDQGGNIRVLAGAETVIKNATICDGQAGKTGGNIFINGGTFTMESGKITGGTVTDGLGANLYVIKQKQGNLEENATLNLNSGSIDGEIYLAKGNAHTLNLADDIQIGLAGEDASKAHGISWTGSVEINGKKVNENAKVVLATIGSLEVTGTGDERAFTILDEEVAKRNKIADDSNDDGIGKLSIAAKMCVCGATDGSFDHTESCKQPDGVWQPWSDATVFPTNAGSYYLTQDMVGVETRSQLASADAIVNLDLAGHTVEGSGNAGMLYRVQAGTLNIADSSEEQTGAIKMTGTANSYGSLAAWGATSKSTYINIFGGTYSAVTGTTVTLRRGHLNMYGGTILPGTKDGANTVANAVQVGVGNNQLTDLNVLGGTIKGEVLVHDYAGVAITVAKDAKVGIQDELQPEKAYGIRTIESRNVLSVTEEAEVNKISVVAYMCVCGKADGNYKHTASCTQPEPWQPWTSTTELPKTNGSYYLTQNLTNIGMSEITDGNKVNLDLAGFTAQGLGYKGIIYRVKKGTLNISDSSEEKTGTIQSNGGTAGTGLTVYVWGNGTDAYSYGNIFGGTFKVNGNVADNGSTVGVANGCLNVYGGTIKGKVLSYAASASLNIFDNAQVGIKDEEQPDKLYGIGTTLTGVQTINFTNANGAVVLKNSHDITISGTGEASKFDILDKHNKVVDKNDNGIGELSINARMCVCGKTEEHTSIGGCKVPDTAWKPWSSITTLPTTTGSHYLISDITVEQNTNISAQVNLDLAGYTISAGADVTKIIQPQNSAVINITCSKDKGIIRNAYQGTTQAYGTVIQLPNSNTHKNACVNLYAGKLTSEGAVNNATDLVGTVFVGKGTFNMYGGTVEDNLVPGAKFTAVRQVGSNYNKQGGTVIDTE